MVDHARGTLLASACGLDQAREDFDEDDLYAAMDEFTGRWVGMEKQLDPPPRNRRHAPSFEIPSEGALTIAERPI